jgi:hypothetical protein
MVVIVGIPIVVVVTWAIPAPIVVIVEWVVVVVPRAVTIVVGTAPRTKHCSNIARLHPHLVAHNHHGVEGWVIGHSEEIGITIAVVPIGGW